MRLMRYGILGAKVTDDFRTVAADEIGWIFTVLLAPRDFVDDGYGLWVTGLPLVRPQRL